MLALHTLHALTPALALVMCHPRLFWQESADGKEGKTESSGEGKDEAKDSKETAKKA